jgi:hypothetical protein
MLGLLKTIFTAGGIVTDIVQTGYSLIKGKTELKRQSVDNEHSQKMERLKQGGTWDEVHAAGSQTSWKDEFWTLVFGIPLILCFIPPTVPYVREGFAILDTMPDWYKAGLGTLIAASVGYQKFIGVMNSRKK